MRVLGTPVADDLMSPRARAVKNSFAHQVYQNNQAYPESMNEKLSLFRRQAPALQGMVMSSVPTGNMPMASPHIIIGSDPGGVAMSTRMSPLFTVPSEERRHTVMPAGPLTGGMRPDGSLAETVYRQPDGKVRNVKGAMSVSRAQQEAALGAQRMKQHRNKIIGEYLGDDPRSTARRATGAVLGSSSSSSALGPIPARKPRVKTSVRIPAQGPTPTPTTVVLASVNPSVNTSVNSPASLPGDPSVNPSGNPSAFPPGYPYPPGYPPAANPVNPANPPATPQNPKFAQTFKAFWVNLSKYVGGSLSAADFREAFVGQEQWVVVVVVVLAVVALAFLIATIVLANRSCGHAPPPSSSPTMGRPPYYV
jgi:hypothetical protein